VKVLKISKEKERVSLGLKQMTPDPWTKVEEKYPVHTRVKVKVLSLVDYGAFVELEKGVEGLIQASEMSWDEKIRHPSQLLNVGTMVDALVLSLDVGKKRISLSLKQLAGKPLVGAAASRDAQKAQPHEGISKETL
jgi:small subunit ribosomal protein S1